ncbi:hypothetical protein LTR86_010182 [Recurvomyces mirabilis]|nr:hypothetical protein LTR86_010182 [Recurvomyces mirabilis]
MPLCNAFGWHVSVQEAQELIHLHGGLQANGRLVEKWPAIAHNDLHAGNVFFRSNGQANHREYPAVVLAGFDQAITEDSSKTRAEIVEYQRKDINDFSVMAAIISARVNDEVSGKRAAAVGEIDAPKKGTTRYDNALQDLSKLIEAGMKRREKL